MWVHSSDSSNGPDVAAVPAPSPARGRTLLSHGFSVVLNRAGQRYVLTTPQAGDLAAAGGPSSSGTFQCRFCAQSFATSQARGGHEAARHPLAVADLAAPAFPKLEPQELVWRWCSCVQSLGLFCTPAAALCQHRSLLATPVHSPGHKKRKCKAPRQGGAAHEAQVRQSYEAKLAARVIAYIAKGHSKDEAKAKFNIKGISTVRRWWRKKAEILEKACSAPKRLKDRRKACSAPKRFDAFKEKLADKILELRAEGRRISAPSLQRLLFTAKWRKRWSNIEFNGVPFKASGSWFRSALRLNDLQSFNLNE